MISSKAIGQYVWKTYGEPFKKQQLKKQQLSSRRKVKSAKSVVKKHSRVRNLPKSATKHSKGASLLTRRMPDATLT